MTQRRVIFAAVVLALAVVIGGTALLVSQRNGIRESVGTVDIGGPFTMTAQDGAIVTEQDLIGHPSLVFFGFTYCPDVCPSTLAEIAGWLDQLGPDGDALEVYFVTVDPARDTPELLGSYVGHFSPRFVALSGSQAQTAEIAASYKAYYKRIELGEGDYTMDHTAAVYLMDVDGHFFDAITFQATPEKAVAKLRRLLAAT